VSFRRAKLSGLPAVLIAAVAAATIALAGHCRAVAQSAQVCGWIGVQVSPLTAAMAESLGMAVPYGAIFDSPEPGSPAAAAKIEAGDLITAINGSALMKAQDFAPTIAAFSPGTIISLSTNRNGEPKEVQLRVGSGKCPQ
jgi:S1-C subfamily serine protease